MVSDTRCRLSRRAELPVGYDLRISEITVKAHRGKVMRKRQARTLPELVNVVSILKLPSRQGAPVHPGHQF